MQTETHGCCSASVTSGSDIMKIATCVKASSSISRSKTVSIGSLFQSFAISAMVLPCSGSSFGFCTALDRNDSGPVTCCHSLFHVAATAYSISLRMRARMAGSFSRSISCLSPPSCAHGGMIAEKVLKAAG